MTSVSGQPDAGGTALRRRFADAVGKGGMEVSVEGTFTPSIFQPYWFVQLDLLNTDEARDADIGVLHREAASWRTDDFSVEVTRQRFRLFSHERSSGNDRLIAITTGVLDALPYTRVSGLTLSFHVHFRADWPGDGSPLRNFLDDSPFATVIQGANASSLTIDGTYDDDAIVSLTVESSLEAPNNLFAGYAYHRDFGESPNDSSSAESDEVSEVLAGSWGDISESAESAFVEVFRKFDAEDPASE